MAGPNYVQIRLHEQNVEDVEDFSVTLAKEV